MKTAVIIPTFNESESIEKTISEIFSCASKTSVVVVDDSSPDETAQIVNKLRKKHKQLFLLRRRSKSGRGSAVIEGFKFALLELRPDIVVEMDADGSHPAKEIPELIKFSDPNTVVVASRYLKKSKIIGWPFVRLRASQLVNFLIRLLLGNPLKDNTNGFRSYPKSAVEILLNYKYISKGFILLSETTRVLKNSGFKFKEIPTTFVDRKLGKSNATPKEFFGSLKALLQMKSYFRPVVKDLFLFFILTTILLISYFPLLKNFNSLTFGNDLASNWIYADFIKENFKNFGQFPLWHNNFLSGFPIDASNLAGIFYPPHLIFLFAPLKAAFNFLTLFHVLLIGFFSYLLATYGLKISRLASFLAGLTIMLSPRIMNHNFSGHINLVESIPWLILSILTFIRAVEKKSVYFSLLTGFILSLIINVFSIFYIYALFVLGFYLLFRLSLKSILLFASSILSSLLFSSIFLFSFFNFSPNSLRTRLSFWDGAFPAIYPESLLELFQPLPQMFHTSETLLYIGIPTLILSIVGLITNWRDKKIWFLFAFSIFALSVSFGANQVFYKIYYRLIPVFHYMRAPARMWILFVIGTGLLSGIGIEYFFNRFPKIKNYLLGIFLISIFLSLWIYNKNYFVFTNYNLLSNPIYKDIPKDGSRVYCLNNCLLEPYTLSNGLQLSSGAEVVLLTNYYDFMKSAGGYNFNSYSLSIPPYQVFDSNGIYFEKQNPNPNLLGITNTKYIVSPYPLNNSNLRLFKNTFDQYIYENLSYLPKAFTVPNLRFYSNEVDLRNAQFKEATYLEGKGKEVVNKGAFKEQTISFYSANQIAVKADLETNGYLVLSELFYPGWKAFVNNKEVPILKVNGVVRGVYLEGGRNDIVFKYFPESLKLGIIVTAVSLTLFVVFSFWKWRYFRSLFSRLR